jgi:hypothetical protein
MQKKILKLFSKNIEIFMLIAFLLIIIITSTIFNYQKNLNSQRYNGFIDNIYLKKTLDEIINNLEPRFKKYNHKIKSGETFNNILESYSIDIDEINILKKNLIKKININKLNTNQKIQITIDQTNNKIKEFIFEISNTEKIYLSRENANKDFSQKILTLKLDKKIIYKENIIKQSLYKAAIDQKIPPIL